MSERPSGFGAASLVSTYAEQAPQTVPGYHDIHTMASVLLAEEAPADAQVLVLGAGGGLEIKAFATAHPRWKFMAVDPSAPMIDLAKDTLGPLAARMDVHEGYVDDAPEGPFDAATALLLLHLTEPEDRLRTVAEVHRRLRPGAPFLVMHVSYPQEDDAKRQRWLDRHVAYLLAAGNQPAYVEMASEMINQHMPALSPDEDRAILERAGFTNVTEFFSAFTFRGWVGYA
ncbi:class I SAM-dependent methyltransferase [Mycolicibacterium llatzerense]|uniref:Methyltransferase n=1 Tax=Mycolicibacterium llatzerense TaxID=280871 RepID=A0A0D1LFZ6_9MYCO|nr:class I SAM-dependent methyltransferase [Mycolicibacterium llatzerense]KIU14931.1 methyltransferase [Mycolicibacterium llatzerense]